MTIHQAAQHLQQRLHDECPKVLDLVAEDAFEDVAAALGVSVDWNMPTGPGGGCEVAGKYDTSTRPPTIRVALSGNTARDRFTFLHEVGHHLLLTDEHWQFDIRRTLPKRLARRVSERVADTLAGLVLIPNQTLHDYCPNDSPGNLVNLLLNTSASLTACSTRFLDLPGERLILVQDMTGAMLISKGTGDPKAPAKSMTQPMLEEASDALQDAPGNLYRKTGGNGIAYANGSVNTDIRMDAVRYGDLTIAVIHSVPPARHVNPAWHRDLPHCATCTAEFQPDDSPGQCATCRTLKCPDCLTCACQTELAICPNCYTTLSISETRAGCTSHEECPF